MASLLCFCDGYCFGEERSNEIFEAELGSWLAIHAIWSVCSICHEKTGGIVEPLPDEFREKNLVALSVRGLLEFSEDLEMWSGGSRCAVSLFRRLAAQPLGRRRELLQISHEQPIHRTFRHAPGRPGAHLWELLRGRNNGPLSISAFAMYSWIASAAA
jgi:hypothetical protein